MHSCGFLPAVTGNRSHGKTGQIADSGGDGIAGQHLADDVLIAAVCGDGGIDDSSFQQAGKKPSGDCQVIALFGIALIICMLPVRKTGGSFFRKYAFVIAAEVVILTGIVLFVIGIVKAWPMLI